jgi:hypothetical protein
LSQNKGKGPVDYHKLKSWLLEGAKPMKGNEKHQLVSAGLLSVPKALAAQAGEVKKSDGPALALSPSKKESRAQ